jgi:hypoxia-inducible factor prolyl 4-hydroxylase
VPPRPLKSKTQNGGNSVAYLFALAAILAGLMSLYYCDNDVSAYHKPTVDHIDIYHHEEVPVKPELISLHPKVFMLHNVLNASDCDAIIEQAKQAYRIPSGVGTMHNKTGGVSRTVGEWRRSTTSWLRKDEHYASDVVKKLVSRIAAAANVSTSSLQRGNPLHVTEYEPDGFYMPHTDSLHVEDLQKVPTQKSYKDLDGFIVEGGYPHSARYFTGLCYLSDEFEGGETIFPLYENNESDQPTKARILAMQNSNSEQTMFNWEGLLPSLCDGSSGEGISIPPERGSCVLFYNHFIDDDGTVGQLDRLSLHAGCTVRGGKKWITNVWAEAIPSEVVRNEERKKAALDANGNPT